ncbi:hypothetical protein, partial [Nitrosopumilus sp.]|uniref:hypothetical protein n=1 Tax=Nitrosopumilus sp. TaxID=2024843 RepID=UPI00247ED0F6
NELETPIENELETPIENELETPIENDQILNSDVPMLDEIDSSKFPEINNVDDHLLFITDYDGARSVIVEGSNGLIVIDTLNSYESASKIFDKLNLSFDKPVKTIILTTINTNTHSASNAFVEQGDGDVEIIIHEDLLDAFLDEHDANIPNLITFSSEFSLDVSDVQMTIVFGEGNDSYQTYAFLPSIDGVIVGDSSHGISPFVFQMRYLQNFEQNNQ